jgi:hypothetical protein
MTPINPAPIELADLAAAMRPDWDRSLFEGALAHALRSWPWPKVYGEVSRMLVQQDATPRDLTVAVDAADPNRAYRPASAQATHEWAAACRAVLEDAARGAAS